jgi:beta-glucanase (GH16 family)
VTVGFASRGARARSAGHLYAVDWRPGRVDFFVDGERAGTVEQAPDYPMQMMIGLFDFPAKPSAAEHAGQVPRFVLDHVRGT